MVKKTRALSKRCGLSTLLEIQNIYFEGSVVYRIAVIKHKRVQNLDKWHTKAL